MGSGWSAVVLVYESLMLASFIFFHLIKPYYNLL